MVTHLTVKPLHMVFLGSMAFSDTINEFGVKLMGDTAFILSTIIINNFAIIDLIAHLLILTS